MNITNIGDYAWDFALNSAWYSVRESVLDCFYYFVWDSVGSPAGLFIGESVEDRVRETVREQYESR